MDDKKTVFIIGAGAHVLYGLPSGYQLRQMICNENLLSEKNLQILREVIISAPEYNSPIHTRNEIDKSLNKQITQFVNNFRYSMMPYIDTFLAVHKDEMSQKIGKAIIAFIFSNLEDRKNFYVGKKINNPYLPRENNKVGEQVDDDWYHIFFRKLSAIKKGGKPPVIITFNYDRYMDYALFNYYRYTTPSMVEEEVMQHYDQHELNKLVHHKMQNESKLYHVYGKVGKLEWEEEKGTSVGFGGARSGDMYKNICENLYIVQDERLNLQVVDAPIKKLTGNLTPEERRLLNQQTNIFNIQKAISEAERLVFLGYGFDDFNNKYIGLDYFDKNRGEKFPLEKVWYTNIGLNEREEHNIHELFVKYLPGGTTRSSGTSVIANKSGQTYNCSDILGKF